MADCIFFGSQFRHEHLWLRSWTSTMRTLGSQPERFSSWCTFLIVTLAIIAAANIEASQRADSAATKVWACGGLMGAWCCVAGLPPQSACCPGSVLPASAWPRRSCQKATQARSWLKTMSLLQTRGAAPLDTLRLCHQPASIGAARFTGSTARANICFHGGCKPEFCLEDMPSVSAASQCGQVQLPPHILT